MNHGDALCAGCHTRDACAAPTQVALERFIDAPRRVEGLAGFTPQRVDAAYLEALGVEARPTPETLAALARGSDNLARRLRHDNLIPHPRVTLAEIDLDSELEIHNYTGACPTLTYEINPAVGCHVGCLYCLVTDGSHEEEVIVWRNYPELLRRALERHHEARHFFYFSPKTEALQEATLQTGVAHEILRVFIAHYEAHPESLARLFVASKAGVEQLEIMHQGESILDLFERLGPRMQFNTSLSLMPEPLRQLLEPNAAPMGARLEAVRRCQARGIQANSALIQPIITPYFTEARVVDLFARLAAAGIVNFKPELLTVDPECLAIIGQLIGHHDKGKEAALYEAYIAPSNAEHKKQRSRTAPERARSLAVVERMLQEGARHGMSASICYWVRKELGVSKQAIPVINHNGFQCLGYQTRLFEGGGA